MDPAAPRKLWQKPGEDKEVVQSAEFPPRLCGHGRTVSGLPEYITARILLLTFLPLSLQLAVRLIIKAVHRRSNPTIAQRARIHYRQDVNSHTMEVIVME